MLNFRGAIKSTIQWLKPDPPGGQPLPLAVSQAMTARDRLSTLLNFREVDENKLVHLDDGIEPAVGFVLGISPLTVAGYDAEGQVEAVINACPPDTIVQFGTISTPQVENFLNIWANARLAKNTNPLLRQIAMRRREFMLKTAAGPSMLPGERLHPRMLRWYVAVRVPYRGSQGDRAEINSFLKRVEDLRNTVVGALRSTDIAAAPLDDAELKFLLRELLNPQMEPTKRVTDALPGVPMHRDLIDRSSRVVVNDEGVLEFSSSGDPEKVAVSCLTVDAAPQVLTLPDMADVLGDPESREDRITCPYWAYTNIHVLEPDDAKDTLTLRLGTLNKQTMSESAWFRSMMGHLFTRRDMTQALLGETTKGHRLVRAYAGINLFCPPEETKVQVEYVKGLWRAKGFRISEEKHISLPVFLASLPLQYSRHMDPRPTGAVSGTSGLQRAWLMSSLNAASMVMLQGDWKGSGAEKAGPLLVSRKGQLATFDLLQTSTNYNFVIVASSGSGKSFFSNELACDFLSRGGLVRLIDSGRSYERLCDVLGGQNIVFNPADPKSVNPFTAVYTQQDLNELMPMLKDLVRLMIFPLLEDKDVPQFEYAMIEKAVQACWSEKQDKTEMSDLYTWLREFNDPAGRTRDMSDMLEPYAVGRYKKWFAGPRQIRFDNPMVVIELQDLSTDPALQTVVLQMMMHQICLDMYQSDRAIPKLITIDEGWKLLSGMRTGRFVEETFRTCRKFSGIAGVITQGFGDFEKSPAAKAALENAAWQFILRQSPESLENAVENKRIVGGEAMVSMLGTVKPGDGFSEVYVRGEEGSGLYRFVTDKHTYYTFTSKGSEVAEIKKRQAAGATLEEAIDQLAQEAYDKMWPEDAYEAAA